MYVEDRDWRKDDGSPPRDEPVEPKRKKSTADDRREKGAKKEPRESSEDSFPASDPPAF